MIETIRDETEPLILGMVKAQPIIHRYTMKPEIEKSIRDIPYKFNYGGFGETVFMRTYSRVKSDGSKESYPDMVIRVVTGIVSIIRDWKIKNSLQYDEERWDDMAFRFGRAMMKMWFLPPGRSLFICGTEFGYKRGSAPFNNCGFVSMSESLIKASCFIFDSLMMGCGLGTDMNIPEHELDNLVIPGCKVCNINGGIDKCNCKKTKYIVHDSREGWVKSLYLLLNSYFTGVRVFFDYSEIRKQGTPLNGFGGEASGYLPLYELHERVRIFMECYIHVNITAGDYININYGKKVPVSKTLSAYDATVNMVERHIKIYPETNTTELPTLVWALSELKNMSDEMKEKKTYGKTRLIADIVNSIGCAVVAGNVRRSSEILLSVADDEEFRTLKDYRTSPERSPLSWMSNNTVCLDKVEDFLHIPEIAKQIKLNGEPGLLNRIATKTGRVNKRNPIGREGEEDKATGVNPCCISGDSLISTNKGLVCVRDLIGKEFTVKFENTNGDIDYVKSSNHGFWSNGVKKVYELTLSNGYIIKTTEDHRIATFSPSVTCNKFNIKWVELKDLDIDSDLVITEEGKTKIIGVQYHGEEEVFDCNIPDTSCFFANGILVHNCEINLESYEYCNLSEAFPTQCNNDEELAEATYLATIYASIVSLLPTHWVDSNKVIARNRRIGVSNSGIVEEVARSSQTEFTRKTKWMYKLVRKTNMEFAKENGVPESIRVTCVKPSGSISQLAGCSSGVHHNIARYVIRRIRMNKHIKLVEQLKKAGYPHEADERSGETTIIFSFPLDLSKSRPASEVSMWEQAANLQMLQHNWADNMVSCTIYFNPTNEGSDIEHVIAHTIQNVKSLSMLPQADDTTVYRQAPYEKISEEEYHKLVSELRPIDFSDRTVVGIEDDSVLIKGCDSGVCDFKAFLNTESEAEHKSKKQRRD